MEKRISVKSLLPFSGNSKIFKDIAGSEWEIFLNDIRERGIISPPLVTPHSPSSEEYTIISGHQRIRAAKELGLDTVVCTIIEESQGILDVARCNVIGRTLTTGERLRALSLFYDTAEDHRKDNGDGGGKNRKDDSVQFAQNRKGPRDHALSLVPGSGAKDIAALKAIRELPQEQQKEMWSFIDEEDPTRKALKEKVNQVNAKLRETKNELRELKKIHLKKREMDEVGEYLRTEIDPQVRHNAKVFDEANRAITAACVEIPKLIRAALRGPLSQEASEMLTPDFNALIQILKEQRTIVTETLRERQNSFKERGESL